jgi:hypothetical protein
MFVPSEYHPANDGRPGRTAIETCAPEIVVTATNTSPPTVTRTRDVDPLDDLQCRVVRLAAAIIHHANRIRPNPSGIKQPSPDGVATLTVG